MKTRGLALFLVLILSLFLAACSTPATKSPEQVPLETQASAAFTSTLPPVATDTTLLPTNTLTPADTSTPGAPTPEPLSTPTLLTINIHINRLLGNTLITFREIKMVSATAGWGIGRGPGSNQEHVFRTKDGGLHWTDITPPQVMPSDSSVVVQAFATFIEQEVWVIFSGEAPMPVNEPLVVWHSVDSGLSWDYSYPLQIDDAPYFIADPPAFADSQHGWLMGHVDAGMSHDYVMLFSTQDGGLTWNRIADPYSQNVPQICCKTGMLFANTQRGWLSGDTNGVSPEVFLYQTQDAGLTWNELTLPAPDDMADAFTNTDQYCGTYDLQLFSADQLELVVRCRGVADVNHAAWLYRTQDDGQTWQNYRLPQSEGSLQMVTPELGFYLSAKGFFRTEDGGKAWALQSKPTWSGVLSFIDKNTGWVAAKAADGGTALVGSANGGVKWTKLDPVVIP